MSRKRSGTRTLPLATGFVGRLTAESLAKARPDIRVGLAGRSADRLHALRQSLGAAAQSWPLIVADLSQPAALEAMADQARVVISAVGPTADVVCRSWRPALHLEPTMWI